MLLPVISISPRQVSGDSDARRCDPASPADAGPGTDEKDYTMESCAGTDGKSGPGLPEKPAGNPLRKGEDGNFSGCGCFPEVIELKGLIHGRAPVADLLPAAGGARSGTLPEKDRTGPGCPVPAAGKGRRTMISLLLSFAVLILAYHTYSKVVVKIFGPDNRETPAIAMQDGVDYVPMKPWRAFLVELLNIAGTGPIFGALMGACFGPVVFLWIVLGGVLAGGVHDYMVGMVSERNGGKSIAELYGIYLGTPMKWIMRGFSVLLLLLTGTVFVTSPASLIARLAPEGLGVTFWVAVILVYYVLATLLPIDKVIGKLYPVFGAVLMGMAFGILGGIVFGGYKVPEITLANLHPENLPVWPFMFVTVACGAISGFHATQAPMMSKCVSSEKAGRKVFYGAMLKESMIALIWAAGGVAFYGATGGLHAALSSMGQSGTVYDIATGMLGTVGGILAIVGVIACPITSGDTAFRSARLILAEITGLDQKPIRNRLIITLPLLGLAAVLTQIDFNILWRYFSWSNQMLAMITLWVITAYLLKSNKNAWESLISAVPASFMAAVTMTYILEADEGLGLGRAFAYPAGMVFAAACFAFYLAQCIRTARSRGIGR